MSDKLSRYRAADAPLPDKYWLWPLYGAGFENLGKDGKMIQVPRPDPGPDELLVRHDAVGICFSDIKVIRAGENHPRIYRNMRENPVVLGHEVSMTVVKVGETLRDEYQVGDRFIIQADIYIGGVGYAYGYEIQGGFSQYNIIDQRVLNGDGGNYLIPVQPETGYAEAALNEPWACVQAAYTVEYRTRWLPGGTLLIRGDGSGVELGEAVNWRPDQMVLDVSDAAFADQVRKWTQGAGVTLIDDDGEMMFDDIVLLTNDPDAIEATFPRLVKGGVFNVVSDKPIPRRVELDIGRIHYDRLLAVGTAEHDLSAAYAPVRTHLKTGGQAWMLGAAGPMGHMHLQRALDMEHKPRRLFASNIHPERMGPTQAKFAPQAAAVGVDLVCLSLKDYPSPEAMCEEMTSHVDNGGLDDIVIMAPSVPAIELAMDYLAENGVMNVFAGLPRGTMAGFDYNLVIQRGARFIGTSGSSIDDLSEMLRLTEEHILSTNSAVAAIASLEGAADGLRAVAAGRFPGKVVIYPNLSPLPLTPLEALKDVLPAVYAKLERGVIWTNEAEEELLNALLP